MCDFSLRSLAIGPSDSFGARRKVVLRSEGNAWAPVLGSFDKLRVKPEKNSIFLKNGKTVILVENRKFSRSRMMKQTAPLNSSREI